MEQTNPTNRAFIYCRVNDKRCLRDLSFQKQQCHEYARKNGYEVAKVFTDMSKKECLYRDGFQELLSFCAPANNNSIDILITPNMDALVKHDRLQLITVIERLALRRVQVKVSTHDQFLVDLLGE